MKNETQKERELRKSTFIARATSHFDTPEIRKEASDMFEDANPSQEKKNGAHKRFANMIEK